VFLEAAWWGCPIIAYHSGGAPEALLDGKLGTLVSPGNFDILSDHIIEILANTSDKPSAILQNQSLINTHFGFHHFCSRLSHLLEKVFPPVPASIP
jgi:phosphatidylinositol alpha-1,6-mannosyltransferase